jgi:ABC-type phosphate transport system auxiliary subunit
MPTLDQQTALAGAISAIRNAENLLTDQIQAADNTLTAIKLTHEYNNLDSYLSELLQAQNAADDSVFANATKQLQSQVGGLQADQAAINSVIADVKLAGEVIGYITKAAALIAKL